MVKYHIIIQGDENKWYIEGKSNEDCSNVNYILNYQGLIKEWKGDHVILPNDFYEKLNNIK